MKKRFLLIASLLLPAAAAFGAGYQLNLQGLRQLAMGGGGVATPWDAATIFYNPGGMSYLDGIQAYGSVQFVIPRTSFLQSASSGGGDQQRTQPQTFTTFNAYVGGTVGKSKRLGLGVGAYTPFGSGTKWEDDFSGRYVSQEIYLQTIFIQPTVSYKICDMLSIGAGFVYGFGNVRVRSAIPVQSADMPFGEAELTGAAQGMGFNAGASVKATDKLSFGISFRSKINMKVKTGTATFTVPQALSDTGHFGNTSFKSSLPLPAVLTVGAAWKPLKKLTVQLDFNLTFWNAFDTLEFDYGHTNATLQDTKAPRNYHRRLTTRLGACYQATDALGIMIGGAYDPTPVRDDYVSPDLPDANRIVLTCGLSLKLVKHLSVLAAVEYVHSEKRDGNYAPANFSGTYQTIAVTPGIGLTYNF